MISHKIINHPTGDQIPIVLNSDGLPFVCINEYLITRRGKSINTQIRNVNEIKVLCKWAHQNGIDLYEWITDSKFFTEAEIRGGLVQALRKNYSKNPMNKVLRPKQFKNRLDTVMSFISWALTAHISTLDFSDNSIDLYTKKLSIFKNWMIKSKENEPAKGSVRKKSLKDSEFSFLQQRLMPKQEWIDASFDAPISRKGAIVFRNYIIFGLMIFFGLRPGEVLSLKTEDIVFGAISSVDIVRRPPDPYDPRPIRPQIKRNGRLLPMSGADFIKIFDLYVSYWRECLFPDDASDCDYLIVNTRGLPLSQDSINKIFTSLRNNYPKSLPRHLSPKALRHKFSMNMETILIDAGFSEVERAQRLAYLRGDSSTKSQDVYLEEQKRIDARNALISYQNSILEKKVKL